MGKQSEPMGNVDAAWLSMDDPTNLMMVSGIMTFRKPLDMDHLMAVVKYRWMNIDRFRQRVVKPTMPLGTPRWELDPHFDIHAHIRRVALPSPGDKAALQTMVSDLMSTPLDYTKPLWQVHVIENYGAGCALMARIHHSIADGMALIFVLLSLTDMTPDAPWPEPPDTAARRENRSVGGSLGALLQQGLTTARSARKITQRVVDKGWQALSDNDEMLKLIQSGVDTGYAASRLLLRTSDPLTPFKGELGVRKSAAWSRPLPLQDIKLIKKSTRTTVNDVLIAAMTGGLRRYLLSRDYDPVDFRAVVPVNLRRPDEMEQMGNKFGLVFLRLPVGIADPLDRLSEVHLRMRQLKDSPEAMVALGILNAIGPSPSEIQSVILKTFATKATGVMTNVPGPPVPLFMAGQEIENIMFWVPQSGRLGLGVSILSYANKVYLGVATDAGLVPDPEVIIEGFYEEYNLLMQLMRASDVSAPPKTPAASAKPLQANGQKQDDLTRIQGVGPKIATLLEAHGIHNFDELAQTQVSRLRMILEGADKGFRKADPTTWPDQARYLASIR